MKVLILGGDGYLGWPTAMHFSKRGDEVCVVDNFSKRHIEQECGVEPLLAIPTLRKRVNLWKQVTGKTINLEIGDLCNHRFIYRVIENYKPDAIIHYGEQPSAPYSMKSREAAVFSQVNNVTGTLNVLFAMKHAVPHAQLIKLGTMGEYGTPNVDIEEGWLNLEHNGRKDRVLFPKKPGSFYHLSKVHDSHNLEFACRIWDIAVTDLNQGVVYGIDTDETLLHEELRTSFHYDSIFGTVLNRFVTQAVSNIPLTVYGKGGQQRGFLNIKDTLNCVALAADNPAQAGEFRIFNQFTECFSVNQLADKVKKVGDSLGLNVKISNLTNPRCEEEAHYFNPKHSKLIDLGLKPNLLTDSVVESMLKTSLANVNQIDKETIMPTVLWDGGSEAAASESFNEAAELAEV